MKVRLMNLKNEFEDLNGKEVDLIELLEDGQIVAKLKGFGRLVFQKGEYQEIKTKINCGLKTCIYNNGQGLCSNNDLELNYFDDYLVFEDRVFPNTDMKLTTYMSNYVGHFMGVQCRDFKMDGHKVMPHNPTGM